MGRVERSVRSVTKVTGAMTKGFLSAGKAVFSLNSLIGLGGLAAALVFVTKQFGVVELAEAAFTPLLEGVKNAKQAVLDLQETAATTPFEFDQLASSAKTLLGFRAANKDNLVETLRMLGDTAGGSGERLDRIALAFGQIKAAGKASMQDINQLINNGIPILGELSDGMGVTIAQLRKMIPHGAATADEVTKAFERMTQARGSFFQGMELASKTTPGLLSTLRDNFKLAAAAIGEAISPVVKRLIKQSTKITKVIRNWANANKDLIAVKFKEMIDALIPKLVKLWEVFRFVVNVTIKFFTFLEKHGSMLVDIAISVAAVTAVFKLFTVAMWALNLAMAANPLGLIIIGVTLLIGGLTFLALRWDTLTESTRNFFKVMALGLGPIGWVILLLTHLENVLDALRSVGEFVGLVDPKTSEEIAGDDARQNMRNVFLGEGGGSTEGLQTGSTQNTLISSLMQQITDAQVTIKDETGRAEIKTSGDSRANVKLMATGGT
jgi:tape measure domain-containing protein